jgi:hypothetical protein
MGSATTKHDLLAELDASLCALATPESRPNEHQHGLFEIAKQLLESEEGLRALHERAHRFDEAGVFAGGPWADPSALQVPLVAGTLRAPGVTPVVETLSELRMLAIAEGRAENPDVTPHEAGQFLDEVMARNLRYLFPTEGVTEAQRVEGDPFRESHEHLFALIAEERGIGNVIEEVVREIEQILAQRPVSTWRVRRMILRALNLAERAELSGSYVETLMRYADAARGPSPLSRAERSIDAYRHAVKAADHEELEREAAHLAVSMLHTGLVAPAHAVLARHLVDRAPDLVAVALGLDEAGVVELERNRELVHELVRTAVSTTTAQCLDGLRVALERTLLSRRPVAAGLERLIALELREDLARDLLAHRADDDPVDANSVLVAGTFAVLGRPLGVSQGRNPTCQAARGISLWAQQDPAQLLELIVSAARDGFIELRFRGHLLRSDALPKGVAAEIDLDLDPVSITLVPHLDRLYSELMRRCALSLEDAHKWVNPALYGRWISNELASAFADLAQTTVANFEAFVRLFFATHHPDHNGGHRLMYPNPVGLVITNHHGRYLGPHAVSIQRVALDPDGETRVYFYNPNAEGRQDWGHGVVTTVSGHGELPGESSLPFPHFAARVYAFHYNANEQGDLAAVPDALVRGVHEAVRTSWGDHFHWL